MTLKEFAKSAPITCENIDIMPYYPDVEEYCDIFGFCGCETLEEHLFCPENAEYMKEFKKYLDWEVVYVDTAILDKEPVLKIEVQERK